MGEGIGGSFSSRDSGKDQRDPIRGFQVCVRTIPWGWGARGGRGSGGVGQQEGSSGGMATGVVRAWLDRGDLG